MKSKRPLAITIICVIVSIGILLTLPMIFSQASLNIGSWYPLFLGFSTILGFVCMIGLWKMKKWGVFIYTIFVAINQILLYSLNLWNYMALLIPAIVIGIGFYYLKEMD